MSVLGVILVRIFWSHTEYILRISPYSVQMRENTDKNNSEYGLFSRSDLDMHFHGVSFCASRKNGESFMEWLTEETAVSLITGRTNSN